MNSLLDVVRRRPADSIAVCAAAVASLVIAINALCLQPGAHPAPLFATKLRPISAGEATGSLTPTTAASPTAPVPAAAVPASAQPRPRTEVISAIQRELARKRFYDGPVDGLYGPRTDTAIRDFHQASGRKTNAEADEAMLRTIIGSAVAQPVTVSQSVTATPAAVRRNEPVRSNPPSKRVMAIQRALSDYGYGQLAPTGLLGAETKTAIERFERERKLPVTGQITVHLTRELTAMTGRPLD
jgi:peptidoglycan hydrolase-like protein with peptidoglycan-binding domain